MDNIFTLSELKPNTTPQFYRINQLVKMLSISKSTIWNWVGKDIFPQPYKLGENITAWRASDIHQWVESRSKLNQS